jgi:hypothetical protein
MDDKLLLELESLGEAAVRDKLSRTEFGSVGSRQFAEVSVWLESKAASRAASNSARALEIAERANEIACSALSSSRRANTIAIAAAILAAAPTIIAAVMIMI